MLHSLKEKVVFVYADDDPDDHEFLGNAVSQSPFDVELMSVYDGSELIGLFDSQPWLRPDFLIVDLNMPRVDGFQAIRHVREQLNLDGMPIYALSTSTNAGDKQKAKAVGATEYFTKPGNIHGLKKILAEMISGIKKQKTEYHGQ